MPTLGNIGNGTNIQTNSTDRKYAYRVLASATDYVIDSGLVWAYISGGVGSSNARIVVYNDNAGEPSAFYATSDEVVISNTSEQQITLPFSGSNRKVIQAGTWYWIGLHFSDPGNFSPGMAISRQNTVGRVRSTPDTYTDGSSDPFDAEFTTVTSNGDLNLYLNLVDVPSETAVNGKKVNTGSGFIVAPVKHKVSGTFVTGVLKSKASGAWQEMNY